MLLVAAALLSATPYEISVAADGTELVRYAVSAASDTRARSRTIYLNRNGGTVLPGANNSGAQTSSIVTRPSQIDGWNASEAQWAATMDCVRQMWSRFDVVITDVDPGQTPHVEAMIGGAPEDLGLPRSVGGVAPMSTTCSVVEHAIVFVFPENLNTKPQRICEVIAQEVGHSYGLDHVLDAADPMTYLSFSGKRTFQDRTASCGETTARPCGIGGHVCRPNQNSVQLLLERLGPAGAIDTAPVLDVSSPADRAIVAPGFDVVATANDDRELASVNLYIDDELVDELTAGPFVFETDPALQPGSHAIRIEAIDSQDQTTARELFVVVRSDQAQEPEVAVGCSTGGAPGLVLAALALLLRRRRRH